MRPEFDPCVGKISWRQEWQPSPVLLPGKSHGAWWAAVHGVAKSWARLNDFTFPFHFPALEKETAPHSSVLAWRIPGTEEPGGLPSMGSHRVGHDGSDLAAAAAADPHSAMMSSRICKYRALRSRIVHDPRASFLNTS